jgi:hypothetical protein
MIHEMIITYESQDGVDKYFIKTTRFHGYLAELQVSGGFWTDGEKYFIPWHQVISVEKRNAKS